MSATPGPEGGDGPAPDADGTDADAVVDGLANYILSVSDEFEGVAGDDIAQEATPLSTLPVSRPEMQAIAVSYKEWVYEEGPRGGDRWRNTDTDEVVYEKPAGADPAPDEDTDESSDAEDTADVDDLDDVPDAGPSALAGGVAAAIDDTRDDFHDIRNAVTGAETRSEAADILEAELSDEQLEAAAEEVATQQEMRENFDEVSDPANLRFGQPVLFDQDRPVRGVVDDVDADGTVWVNKANRDLTSGVSPEYGTLYADPDYEGVGDDDAEPFTAEPGRFGLASNPEVLENAFEAADDVQGAREAGIQGGNTTGDDMKILEMDDGSRVFATPVSAYPGTTGVVGSPAEARENNLQSPKVIESLGGSAAKTRITEGPGGEEYIAKEGFGEDTAASYSQQTHPGARGDDIPDQIKESAKETMAAAYFVGNTDLHGGNVAVNTDEAEVGIIDHDAAGKIYRHERGAVPPDLSRYDGGPRGISVNAREDIYEKAQQLRAGEVDLDVSETSDHAEFAQDAADKAVRAAYVDPSYDLPDDQVPAECQFPPSGIETIDDFEDPNDDPDEMYSVSFVSGTGDVVEGEVLQVEQEEDRLVIDADAGGITFVDDPNQVVEIL